MKVCREVSGSPRVLTTSLGGFIESVLAISVQPRDHLDEGAFGSKQKGVEASASALSKCKSSCVCLT